MTVTTDIPCTVQIPGRTVPTLCHVRVIQDHARTTPTLILCSEIHDQPGMSITNAAEHVFAEVCQTLRDGGLLHRTETPIWIEHYRHLAVDSFDIATFSQPSPTGLAADTKTPPSVLGWQRASLEALCSKFGHQREAFFIPDEKLWLSRRAPSESQRTR